VLGIALYASVPSAARSGSLLLFVFAFCVVLSMYGGGFATVPAYLADLFGTQGGGESHGRLLTAWSTAGVLGPVLVNYIREYQLDHGVQRAEAYSITMYILAGLLALGLLCNWAVRPVAAAEFTSAAPPARDGAATSLPRSAASATGPTVTAAVAQPTSKLLLVAAWAAVVTPICWGVAVTLQKTALLFR